MAEILITQFSNPIQVAEAGKPTIYKIRLAEAPSAPVTVTIATDGQTLIANPHQPLYRQVKIMPIGDSITYGVIDSRTNTESGGYRTYLWRHLKLDRYRVNFIGSQTNGPRSIDRDHEGYRGQDIESITRLVDRQIAKNQPDVVLLLAGTNDILQNRDLAHAPQRLGRLIDQILRQSPKTTVLVGTLPPNTRSSDNPHQIRTFNQDVVHLVNQKIHRYQKVKWVDIAGRLSPQDLADQTHLTERGYQKMAQAWYASLLGVLNSSDEMSLARVQTFTFTPRNWQIPQTVTVIANDDQIVQGKHSGFILHQAQSVDTRYDGQKMMLPVTVKDDDPGLIFRLLPHSAWLDEGTTTTYQIGLSTQPVKKVMVNLSPDRQLHLSRLSLTFTPSNWKQLQTVEMTAIEDATLEDLHLGVIRHQVQSRDLHYQDLRVAPVTVPIAEQDWLPKTGGSLKFLQLRHLEGEPIDRLLQANRPWFKTPLINPAETDRLLNFGLNGNHHPNFRSTYASTETLSRSFIEVESLFSSQAASDACIFLDQWPIGNQIFCQCRSFREHFFDLQWCNWLECNLTIA